MSSRFDELCSIIARLRAPDGCPWDREQTPQTLRTCLIEECFEAVNAVDRNDTVNLREELGDLLLNIVMICQIFGEKEIFSVDDVLKDVNKKLIRRHPHVFGDAKATDAREALAGWNAEKQKEKKTEKSVLDSVPSSYPSLLKAWKMQQKAAKVGFDWPDPSGAEEKLFEEHNEIKKAEQSGSFTDLEEECGDFLFAAVNWLRLMGVNPETALNRANEKFDRRFRFVETRCRLAENRTTSDKMNDAWNEVKKEEKKRRNNRFNAF